MLHNSLAFDHLDEHDLGVAVAARCGVQGRCCVTRS